jgi:hypothetical protein
VNIHKWLWMIGHREEEWIDNLNRWIYLYYWMVATVYSNSHLVCHCGEKIVNQRWRYKSKLKIELKSNFTFKWFVNVDVEFEMNGINDQSWESYTPADHWNIIINEVDFPVDYPIFLNMVSLLFLSYCWPLAMNAHLWI